MWTELFFDRREQSDLIPHWLNKEQQLVEVALVQHCPAGHMNGFNLRP